MKLSTALAQIHFSKTFFCGAKIRKNIGGPRLNVRVLATRIRSTRTGIWLTPSPRCLHASRTESWSVTRTPNLLIFQGIRGVVGGKGKKGRGLCSFAAFDFVSELWKYLRCAFGNRMRLLPWWIPDSPRSSIASEREGGRKGIHVLGQFKNLSCVIHESAVGAWCKCLWAGIRF